MDLLFIILLLINIFSFIVFWIDKFLAIKKKRRISENFLIFISLFAPFGSIMGMIIFNHKTSKIKFRFFIPFFVLLQSFGFYFTFYNNLL